MLIDEIKTLPNNSGVYEYFDKDGKLLYVGKAKNLKNRVRSYFSFTSNLMPNPKNSARIQKMISEAVHLEYIITNSESDALILENSFIKQLKPKYNILLRDDKTYPYIYLDLNEAFPRPKITRKVIKGSNIKYFGPYFRGAKEILDAIYKEFMLVQKNGCLKEKKACLFYQIKRCLAPCENKINKEEYEKIIKECIKALQNPQILIPKLEKTMLNYAENENYEEAAKIRDSIKIIEESKVKIEVDLAKLEDFEVLAINCVDSLICSTRFSIRDGKISGSNSNIINSNLQDDDYSSFYKQIILQNFNTDAPINSNKIYVYQDFSDRKILEEILSQKHNRKIQIIVPKIGEKKKLTNIAFSNAEIFIKKHQKTHNWEFLREIKEYFSLENLPVNIEIFDNSHMFGTACVGAMVAYNIDGFNKANYRHSHLNSKNDYDQMFEFLTQRVERFEKIPAPDLWVIDGGDALLKLAKDILNSVGANVDVIAISKEKIDFKAYRAKGNAKDKIYTQKGKFNLSTDDKKLQFFQKLRDEAHRFAISFHQKTKKAQDMQNSKLLKLGISQGSIEKLIKYYGSFENIYNAKYDEIKKITNKAVAEKIFKNLAQK